MDNIVALLSKLTDTQNNVQEFLGTPVSNISNYKPWMEDKEISKYYQLTDDGSGKKKVTLKKSLSADDLEIYNKDQDGNDLSSIDGEKLGRLFGIATTRYNVEAGADNATGIQPIGRYPSFDATNVLGITKDVISDYINVVLNPDTPTELIKSPDLNTTLASKLNGSTNAVFSDLSDTYLGTVKNFSANNALTDSVSRSLFDTVVGVKKDSNSLYMGSDFKPFTPLTSEEVANLSQQYADTDMLGEANRFVKDMAKSKKNGSSIANEVSSILTQQYGESSSMDANLATAIAMHQNGLGKYAPITKQLDGEDTKYITATTVDGIPTYDPSRGFYVRTEMGEVPVPTDQLTDDVKKMAMDNNILQRGSGAYRTRGDLYATYGGRVSIPTTLLPKQ